MLKRCFYAFLLCSLLLFPSACFSNYSITETELTTLEQNLNELAIINKNSEQELIALNSQLTKSRQESTALSSQLSELKTINAQQEKSLIAVNLSLQEYAREAKRKQRIMRWQRNAAWGCVIAAVVIAIKK